jgi:predicted TIM-barrel fold metal-dependent hydrolase
MRPGCYDIHERIRDMNANGQVGSLCFPTFPGYSGRFFAANPDRKVALAMLKAYNDWNIDEWCGTYPGRFIPCGLPIPWDMDEMVNEVKRLAAKGTHAVTFTENPENLGFPSFHTDHWDPFWTACVDERVVVCIHIGSGGKLPSTMSDSPIDVSHVLSPMNIVSAATELLFSPTLRRFPGLKIALSEGGIGWIPYFLERIDHHHERNRYWTGQDFADKRPSDVFREHFIVCFVEDHIGIESRRHIGIDNIAWEADFPHGDGDWPVGPEVVHRHMIDNGVPDDEVDKMTHLNVMREFSYDPFSAFGGRENCTVGALRAQAKGVNLVTVRRQRQHTRGKDIDVRAYRGRAASRHAGKVVADG